MQYGALFMQKYGCIIKNSLIYSENRVWRRQWDSRVCVCIYRSNLVGQGFLGTLPNVVLTDSFFFGKGTKEPVAGA
jgi:hypothetical protein